MSHVMSGVKRCVCDNTNTMLLEEFQAKEVYCALKMLGPTKASGEDGIPASSINVFGT